jgi:hypothetical protein
MLYSAPSLGALDMDVLVSIFAVIVALGCFVAIFMASRKDKKKEDQGSE